MRFQSRFWRIVLPVLLIVLLVGTATGRVCHSHAHESASVNCTLCHLAIAPPVSPAAAAGMAPAVARLALTYRSVVSSYVALEIPPRAPPA